MSDERRTTQCDHAPARMPALTFLFAALTLVMLLQPALAIDGHPSLLAEATISVIPLSATYSLRGRAWQFRAALLLLAPVVVLWVLVHGVGWRLLLRPWELLASLVLLGFVSGCLLHCLLRAERVTTSLLFGAAALYLLLGFAWTHSFALAVALNPHAFGDTTPDWNALTYFSFSTLTTLGIGDLAPLSPLARTLTSLEAATGVLFVGFIISRFAAVAGRSS